MNTKILHNNLFSAINRYKIKIVFLSISLLFFTKCNKSKKINYQKKIQLIDSLSIYFPDTIPLYNSLNCYSWNYSDKRISFLYDYTKKIILYHYSFKNNLWNSTVLTRYGENGVLFKGKFDFINDSCIIYAPSYKKKIFEINIHNSKIIRTYNYPKNYSISHQKHFQIYTDSSKIILPVNYIGTKDPENKKAKLAMFINKSNDSCIFIINYPESFRITKNTSSVNKIPEIVFQKHNAVLNFPADNQIYAYNYDTKITKQIDCQTNNIIKEEITKTNDNLKNALLEELRGRNITILYDKYNNLYYRLSVSHPSFTGFIESKKDALKQLQDYIVTISAIDTNFNLLASNDFNGANFNITHYFVNKNGLYIKSNFGNENEMRFIRFNLVKN